MSPLWARSTGHNYSTLSFPPTAILSPYNGKETHPGALPRPCTIAQLTHEAKQTEGAPPSALIPTRPLLTPGFSRLSRPNSR